MSTSSTHSSHIQDRINSLRTEGRSSRNRSRPRPRPATPDEAYIYALAVGYLSYLLQPRGRRLQHVPAPAPLQPPAPAPLHRSSGAIQDLMRDFNLVRDFKSTRFPHGFLAELEKRLTGVLVGKERRPEYADAAVKRTFAVFYTAFTEQSFRRRMEQDRRVEDLVLIFFSSATKELQKGQLPTDDGWKLMVDRHVALFVRMLTATLKDHDWARDRPELVMRLATLESKLLTHDQDLAASTSRAGGAGGSTIEVEAPLSYEVKDMPLVLVVSRLFAVPHAQLQADVNRHRTAWTEQAALMDLKLYQKLLNLNSRRTLRSDDFDVEEAYERWKKAESKDLSQLMLAIIQAHPALAKTTSGGSLLRFTTNGSGASDPSYSETMRKIVDPADTSGYVIDQPVDMSDLSLNEESGELDDGDAFPFTFIPPDARSYYRTVLAQALTLDLNDPALLPSEDAENSGSRKLLSNPSAELLNEISIRWRIPPFSRAVFFMDVVRQKFLDQEMDLDTLDAAFTYVKDPPREKTKGAHLESLTSLLADRSRWTLADFALYRQILSALHDALLRDLYDALQHCYEPKPPSVGPVMYVLQNHVTADPVFSKSPGEDDRFAAQLADGLRQQALAAYSAFLHETIPQTQDEWQFHHVLELGKAVFQLADRIQKRYQKSREVMGVDPWMVLMETVLPAYAADARDLVERILSIADAHEEDIDIQEGFDLYREMVEKRRVQAEILPDIAFAFPVEEMLAVFVWRWIQATDEKMVGWVDQAIKQDRFTLQAPPSGEMPTDDQRHSVSVVDMFRSFSQSIEPITRLQWQDEWQHAKFITALARTVGNGIARYCEVVEQRFAKEMDRLSPEQEAAANQSRQDKWMQLAKEAWTNREKIEPFQFYSESLVKLNNIEWATYQLDELERSLDVDACADVILRYSPPTPPRQAQNFVFTIKIVEAEDLKACDLNGYSDPYVVLGDEYQKRLAKTRIIYASLNPRWDESVDIITQGPLNIVATIWDWDAVGDHDCVGRTSLKLDPSHFSDYLPREYWLDLDTQGRLLLRVSMEGERDDIQFYFGKAFRTLKRSERDMTRKITDKLSSYIHHCLSRGTLRSLLNKGISIASVSSLFSRGQRQSSQPGPSEDEITSALQPLFQYLDDNFALMKQTLTDAAMVMVMTRVWKEILATIEALLVPPLSDKVSQQRPLTQQELDIVFKWAKLLFDFFQAVDEQTGTSEGVPLDVLKSPKYHEIQSLNFFYFESTDNLIRISERMASATLHRQHQQRNRFSAPGALGLARAGGGGGLALGGAAGQLGTPSAARRSKSIMLNRNLGTIKKAKEEKRKEAQADPNDDIILRILRMRPEAAGYLKERSRQRERLAAAAAAELIVRQSLLAGGGGGRGLGMGMGIGGSYRR
ncbi:MAG: hypothetical protein M1826_007779 [Phylliscum demangeonii]|nr:MAG: hypothetical protein M1826_007779 [Phylliscum demangeonii]